MQILTRLVTALLCAVLLSLPVVAQVVPSTYTPLGICSLYSASTPANTDIFLQVRDVCNIPQTANAVSLIAATTVSAGNGVLYVWDAGIVQPAIPSMYVRVAPGGDSSTLIVRLCHPLLECGSVDANGNYHGTDITARLTASAFLTLSAVGYFEPAEAGESVSMLSLPSSGATNDTLNFTCTDGVDCWTALGDSILPVVER